jgi:DNA mismatch repair protein MutH
MTWKEQYLHFWSQKGICIYNEIILKKWRKINTQEREHNNVTKIQKKTMNAKGNTDNVRSVGSAVLGQPRGLRSSGIIETDYLQNYPGDPPRAFFKQKTK